MKIIRSRFNASGNVVRTSLFLLALNTAPSLGEETAQGSLYPADLVEPIKVAQENQSVPSQATTISAVSQVEKRQTSQQAAELIKALGPAGYLVDRAGVDPAFTSMVRRAVGRHPAFHAQISQLGETNANRRAARSQLYPQLSTQLRGDYVVTRDFDPGTDNVVESLRPREQFTAGISASQLLFDGGTTFQRIKSARARDSEFRFSLQSRINDLAMASLAAYHDLATHQALTVLGDAYIRRHQDILSSVRERVRLGAGARADETQARARLAAAEARVAEIRESTALAEIRYREFFGEDAGLLVRPSFDRLSVDSREQAIAAAADNNPEIAVAQARADAQRADYKAAKGSRLPEVRLSVDAVKFDVFETGDDFDVRAGLNVNYNLFGGGARAAEISAAASRAQREKFNAEQVQLEVSREASIAFERRRGADARLAALATAVIAHDETRDLVLERYRVSRGDLIDVLQAENDYFDAGVNYLTGLASRDMAIYGLMEHTGDLLRYFSPENEYQDVLAGGR